MCEKICGGKKNNERRKRVKTCEKKKIVLIKKSINKCGLFKQFYFCVYCVCV